MARFIPALPGNFPAINFHVFSGVTLFVLTASLIGSIALFGSDKTSIPRVSVRVPSLAESSNIKPGLRVENTGAHAIPAISGYATEPSLDGITDPGTTSPPALHATNAPASAAHTLATTDLPFSKEALPNVPMAGMTEPGPGGLLPKISPAGLRPSQAYARTFELKNDKPVVALVVGGLGMMKSTTNRAIEDLPPEVTLSFVPYTPDLQNWILKARAMGHEVLIELPMEPFGYPETDPGPYTLLSSASSAENTRRLEWLLSRATGYFGVTNYMGSKLTASENALAPVFRGLSKRGIDFLYDGETRRSSLSNVAKREGLHWGIADRIVDSKQTPAAIDDQLLRLEALAIQNGNAIGKGFSWPITIKQLKDWSTSLDAKGYQLAPVSTVIKMRNNQAGATTKPPETATAEESAKPAADHH